MENLVWGNGVDPDLVRYGSMIDVASASLTPRPEATRSETAPVAGAPCQDSDYFREQAVKAAEQMAIATLCFLRNLVASRSDDAITNLAEMRRGMIRCSAASNVWTQHLMDHGCE